MATTKRRARTQRIERSALELFSERGYDATTVAEIARHAGVSRRTVFRHFGRKRELVFWEAGRNLERLLAELAVQPDEAPPAAALHGAIAAMCEDLADDVSLLRMRAVRSDPTLRLWGMETRATWTDAASAAIAERWEIALSEARVIVGMLLLLWTEAMASWAEQRPDEPLPDVFADQVERAAGALGMSQPLSGRSG